jgi:hypothetical protein
VSLHQHAKRLPIIQGGADNQFGVVHKRVGGSRGG